MIVPFLWACPYLWSSSFWAKAAFSVMLMGSVVTVILTYSRGGAVALAVVFLMLIMRSKYRVRSLALILVAVIPVLGMVGVTYEERLSSIETYQEDASAVSRLVQSEDCSLRDLENTSLFGYWSGR